MGAVGAAVGAVEAAVGAGGDVVAGVRDAALILVVRLSTGNGPGGL